MKRNLFLNFLTFIYLFNFIDSMMIKRGKYCKKRLIESYNLTSFTTFRKQDLFLCPAITSSCCSHYEQFTMYTEWKHKYKQKFEEYQENIRKKIRRLKQLVEITMSMDLKKKMKKLRITRAQRGKLIYAMHRMKSFDYKQIFRQLDYFQNQNDSFMMRLRQSFYCQICDFNNHYWINMKEQSIKLAEGSCQYLAENTSTYSYVLNVKLVMFLWFMNKVMVYFSNPNVSPKPITLLEQKKVVRAVKTCGKFFIKKGYIEGAICNKYCEYFNMNGNMPVFEGYQRYFNDQINFLRTLLDYQDVKIPRLLSSNLAHFSKKQLSNIKDPYNHKSEDPVYTDYFINQMYNFEQFYDQGRKNGYVNFVKNKYSFFDVSIVPGGKDKQLFKTTPVQVVKLENYVVKIKPRGVEFGQHVKINNMNTTYRDLIYHLKNRTPHKIAYEKLDPTLIRNLNEISNTEIRDFHADNFQNFVDYSSEQISQSIKRKPDLSMYKGYNLSKI